MKWLRLASTGELKLCVTTPAGDATVTISHRYTPKEQLKQHTIRADIVVAAAGETILLVLSTLKQLWQRRRVQGCLNS